MNTDYSNNFQTFPPLPTVGTTEIPFCFTAIDTIYTTEVNVLQNNTSPNMMCSALIFSTQFWLFICLFAQCDLWPIILISKPSNRLLTKPEYPDYRLQYLQLIFPKEFLISDVWVIHMPTTISKQDNARKNHGDIYIYICYFKLSFTGGFHLEIYHFPSDTDFPLT